MLEYLVFFKNLTRQTQPPPPPPHSVTQSDRLGICSGGGHRQRWHRVGIVGAARRIIANDFDVDDDGHHHIDFVVEFDVDASGSTSDRLAATVCFIVAILIHSVSFSGRRYDITR
jgi:hypothetical protein